jgi:rubrerythrin
VLVFWLVSLIETFKKIVDPVQAREREEELRKEREQPKRDQSSDPPRYVCRICGHASDDKSYCPECLADTMRPVRSR